MRPTLEKSGKDHVSTAAGTEHPPSPIPVARPAAKSFHRRKLPAPAIEFSSKEGQQIFIEALAAGCMGGFFRLIEQFHTQDEPAYCGLGTLTMVLNALNVDPGRTWKGPWRWFHEEMLSCCMPLDDVKANGIIWPYWVCLARCNGAFVDARRPDEADGSLDVFRNFVRQTTALDIGSAVEENNAVGPLKVLVVSYSRKQFSQTGDGHFSPIGGYHPGRDLVLILDVARFKHPPHWVPLEEVYKGIQRIDPTTGRCRGFALLSSSQKRSLWLNLIAKTTMCFPNELCDHAADDDRDKTAEDDLCGSSSLQGFSEVRRAFVSFVSSKDTQETTDNIALARQIFVKALDFSNSPAMPFGVICHSVYGIGHTGEISGTTTGGGANSEEDLARQAREAADFQQVREGFLELVSLFDKVFGPELLHSDASEMPCDESNRLPLQALRVAQILVYPECLWEESASGCPAWQIIAHHIKKESLPPSIRFEVEALRSQLADLLTRTSEDMQCGCYKRAC